MTGQRILLKSPYYNLGVRGGSLDDRHDIYDPMYRLGETHLRIACIDLYIRPSESIDSNCISLVLRIKSKG
jgi:hypothetical protein